MSYGATQPGPALARRGRRAASGVAAGALMAFATIAVLVLHASQRRTELVYRGSIDSMQNPAAGSGKGGWGAAEADFYTGENPDAPGTPSSWQWATTDALDPSTGEAGVQEGHGTDWIYDNGPVPGPIKGARSHYYNEFQWDSDPETSGDFVAGPNVPAEDLENENFVANERSNPDHHTSEPYTHESSYGVLEGGIGDVNGKSGVANILNFDPWLMNSNNIY